MDFLIQAGTHIVAFGVGCMFYRYWLRRDPARLERWAQEIKRAGARATSGE